MPRTVARFQLLESIGCGTLGELHRARDLQLGRTVAVRLVAPAIAADPAAIERVFGAARQVLAASHPSLVALYEWGTDVTGAYIATEFAPGPRLSAVVNGSPLNRRRAFDIAAQVADGLATAHAHGLHHGAISTDAVIVTPKGAAKVLDLGFGEWTRGGGLPPIDDYAGLGAMLFEMLVGRPLKAGWPGELRDSQIPAGLRDVLERLTLPHARERFDSMATVAATLRLLAEDFEPDTVAARSARASAHQRGAGFAVRATALLAALAALLLAVWWLVAD